ncbi:16S rRNA (adenine(1518)-N(6)/adenine(1519)-N(6))-dimethyltransferase RsmA [Horticoccus luteus]|uniref:Ribosomal RNA small subunit methyltransferase A n=1 Tax=Horticoccus luteus TaxID=2862869 RepID=A0A8F9TRQ8_9BACT|nr:16S rRNA (adenine(1518)-N(6)/adenine(1519)-N(6))-dimethyltransferase RsmA [Horticoccus luteus]QYM77776.1 16S rRNA (adenine(1518)-N(6)/adenine(1519)-N(6))-dimethyltransferase RsmA [Horticoccus luteus]
MPLTPSSTRDLLAALGHTPKRYLGQNFLVDGNIVRKSLELARLAAGDTVVEIGPGLGTLTSALLEAGADVWAVEMDRALAQHLRETLAPRFPAHLHLLEGDAIDHPLANLPAASAAAGFKVIANLPYAISTPWMDAVLSGPLPERLVLMLQQEAAQRYAALPGSKTFGAISIFLQSAYEIAPGHKVAAACFHPRPEIESYLLHLVRRPPAFVFDPATKTLIRACFQQRRKQIAALLRGRLPDDGTAWLAGLAEFDLTPRARPEEIPVAAWQRLHAA